MKITAAEFVEWTKTGWPRGFIFSGDTRMPDGRDIFADDGENLAPDIQPNEKIDLSLLEGIELEDAEWGKRDERSIAAEIRKWRKTRDTVLLVARVPNDQVDAFRAICTEKQWGIV